MRKLLSVSVACAIFLAPLLLGSTYEAILKLLVPDGENTASEVGISESAKPYGIAHLESITVMRHEAAPLVGAEIIEMSAHIEDSEGPVEFSIAVSKIHEVIGQLSKPDTMIDFVSCTASRCKIELKYPSDSIRNSELEKRLSEMCLCTGGTEVTETKEFTRVTIHLDDLAT